MTTARRLALIKRREKSAKVVPVTLVVTTYHRPALLAKTLESIASLHYPKDKIHVVVVRDHEDLAAEKIVETFRRKYGFNVKIVTLRGGTVSRARNIGIVTSTTEIVAVVDDDVVLHPRTISAALEIFKENNRIVAVGFPAISNNPALSEKLHSWRFLGMVSYNANTVMPVTFFRKSLLMKIGLYREDMGPPASIHEDWELGSRIKKKGFLVVVEGRIPQRHMLEERKVSDLQNRQGIIQTIRLYISSYIQRNWWTLLEVLRVSPLTQKAEYIFYYLFPYTALVLLVHSPLLSLMLITATGLITVLYYLAMGYYSRLTLREQLVYPALLVSIRVLRAQLSLLGLLYHKLYRKLQRKREKGK